MSAEYIANAIPHGVGFFRTLFFVATSLAGCHFEAKEDQ